MTVGLYLSFINLFVNLKSRRQPRPTGNNIDGSAFNTKYPVLPETVGISVIFVCVALHESQVS